MVQKPSEGLGKVKIEVRLSREHFACEHLSYIFLLDQLSVHRILAKTESLLPHCKNKRCLKHLVPENSLQRIRLFYHGRLVSVEPKLN